MVQKRFTIEDYYDLSPNDVIDILNEQQKLIELQSDYIEILGGWEE